MDFFEQTVITPGCSLKLIKDTTSLKKGQNVIVTGFHDEDKNKIICEGILPGSWIPTSNFNIEPKIKEGLRLKTLCEIISEFGICFSYNHNVFLDHRSVFGCYLTPDVCKIITVDGKIYFAISGVHIEAREEYLTFDPIVDSSNKLYRDSKNFTIKLKSEEYFKKVMGELAFNSSAAWCSDMKRAFDLDIRHCGPRMISVSHPMSVSHTILSYCPQIAGQIIIHLGKFSFSFPDHFFNVHLQREGKTIRIIETPAGTSLPSVTQINF